MIDLDITFDYREVERALNAMERKQLPLATTRAINKTAKQAHTVAVKETAKDIRLPQKDVRAKFKLLKATRRHRVARIIATGKRVPLTRFNAKQLKQLKRGGVTYKGKGGRKKIPGAFIARMPSGHVGVFTRQSKKRLPIYEKFGPSIPHVFLETTRAKAAKQARRVWKKNMEHELRFALQRARLR